MQQLAIVASVAVLSVANLLAGQSSFATIRGTIADPQQRVVPNASVQIVDQATGATHAVSTGETGTYEVSGLQPGRYVARVTAAGFKTSERTIAAPAGETVRVDIDLQVGDITDIVSVVAAQSIRLESPAIEDGLDAAALRSLPRNSRDFRAFLFLNPNVVGDADNRFQFLGGRTYGVSYVQDGQPSTGSIFANVANASPGLEAISEVKVVSSSASAEHGGLASVIVTTRRGGNRLSATAFYDVNADELNTLTYTQMRAGLRRGFPGSDTSDHQYGIAVGGPLQTGRTFFFAAFEGLRRSSVGGGSIVSVPTDRMRAGDFSGNTFQVRDPRTGQPFPGNVIPSERVDAAASRVLEFFYPRANLPALANGVGRSQQFVNLETAQDRWDVRVDHERSPRHSIFGRVSWQDLDAGSFLEDAGLPNLGVQDRRLQSRTASATWRSVVAPRLVAEIQAGYVTDRSNRRSRYEADAVTSALGLEVPPYAIGRRGYPAFSFQGANSIRSIADPSTAANRDTRTSTVAISHKLTWQHGRHSIRLGAQYTNQSALDGFSLGVSGASGLYVFTGTATGNSFADFLLGLPTRVEEGINTRGARPLDTHASALAVFAQDEWTISRATTLFGGLRYELAANFVERNNLIVNFDPRTGSLVLPAEATAQFLSPEARALPRQIAADIGLGRALVRPDLDNISPRVGFAHRFGDGAVNTVLRGGAGYMYPTNAAQGIRDALSRAPFRFAHVRTNAALTRGLSTGTRVNRSLFGVNAVDFGLERAEALQHNLTVEREIAPAVALRVSYIGTIFRKLLVNRDLNTVPPSTDPLNLDDPNDRLRLPYPHLDPFLNIVENGGSGNIRLLQVELRRRAVGGAAFTGAYTLAGSETTAPDLGNSTLGVVQYAPYDRERDRGPDPNVVKHRLVANAVWPIPFGGGEGTRSWLTRLLDGWTATGIVQARSGQHLTPFFRYGTDPVFPANTGKAYDTNNSFAEAWRPDVVGNPRGLERRDRFFNIDAFRVPQPGQIGNARKGLLEGPGMWVVNLGLYKNIVQEERLRAELRLTLDNAFNQPQFLVTNTSGFLDLTDFLINGIRDNGVTNVLNEVGSLEGFAPARVIRLGIRVEF